MCDFDGSNDVLMSDFDVSNDVLVSEFNGSNDVQVTSLRTGCPQLFYSPEWRADKVWEVGWGSRPTGHGHSFKREAFK